jgi:hypothetical protein
MKYEKMNLKDSYKLLKEKRNISSPNPSNHNFNIGFISQLMEYEKQLFNKITLGKYFI